MVSVILVFCLLGGSIYGVWYAYTAPAERDEQVTTTLLSYTLYGDFGYDVQLTDNDLYGPIVLTEEDTSLLYLNIVESIEGNFSYQLSSSESLDEVSHQVEIAAILENTQYWSKSIELIAETVETGDFTIAFPVDTVQLLDLADAIDDDLGLSGSSYDLTIQAAVHTVAPTDYGVINETFTQSMSGTLQANRLTWDSGLTQNQSGSFQETDTVTIPIDNSPAKIGSAVALAFFALLGSYVVWSYTRVEPIRVPVLEEEARRVRKKYKELIVDVVELPAMEAGERLIEVDRLDDLVKTAEQLLRLVLHKAEPEKHTYCVIDGLTRYEYVSLEPESAEENDS